MKVGRVLLLMWLGATSARAEEELVAHPRLHLDAVRTAFMRAKATSGAADYERVRAFADAAIVKAPADLDDPYATTLCDASLFIANGDAKYRDAALTIFDWILTSRRLGPNWPAASMNPLIPAGDFDALSAFSEEIYMVALASDWLYGSLGTTRLASTEQFLSEYGDAGMTLPSRRSGPVWSVDSLRWMSALAAIGMGMGPGAPWDEYTASSRAAIDSWTAQLCDRFAEGGGNIIGIGQSHHQVNLTRASDMLYTASRVNKTRGCGEYFGTRAGAIVGGLRWWERGGGFFPFRGGDFADDAGVDGWHGSADLVEEALILMRWGSEADARQVAFALEWGDLGALDTARVYAELCFRDPAVQPADRNDMPLSHHAVGTGEITARSDWTSTRSPAAAFFCGPHRSNRMHLDQNSVQLTGFGGELLLDSGNSDSLSSQDTDGYTSRTVAHNTLLIKDPAETFLDLKIRKTYPPDSGQRGFPEGDGPDLSSTSAFRQKRAMYDTGDVLRFEDTGAYAYALGDATNAYNSSAYVSAPSTNSVKCGMFQREFVFLRSGRAEEFTYLVLFDRVEVPASRREQLRVCSLFHFLNEPALNGTPTQIAGDAQGGIWRYAGASAAEATDSKARVFLKSLLPADAVISKVGGRSYEQYSDGKNYTAESNHGEWRIEIESPVRSSSANFLTVATPVDISRRRAVKTELITSDADHSGVYIRNPGANWVLMFSRRADGEPASLPFRYMITPQASQRHLVFDLVPGGSYSVQTADIGDSVLVRVDAGGSATASAAGVLAFNLPRRGNGSDTTPPSGSFVINGQGSYSPTQSVLLMVSAEDAMTGMIPGGAVSVSNDGKSWSAPIGYEPIVKWQLAPAEGGKTVQVKFRDAAGNWSSPVSDTIILTTSGVPTDKTPPSASVVIDGGVSTTEDAAVVLSLEATDFESGIGPSSLMQISNDGTNWSTAEPFSRSKSWTLSDGKGAKTVSFRVSDQAGNWSPPAASVIAYQ